MQNVRQVFAVKICFEYTQSPIIRNGPIRLGAEFRGKFKKQALGRSNLRNAWKNLRNAERSDFQSLETTIILHFCNSCNILINATVCQVIWNWQRNMFHPVDKVKYSK